MEVERSESEIEFMAKAKSPVPMVQIRLLPEIDAEFRKLISRRGDVRAVVMGMLEAVDLRSVALPEMLFRRSAKKAKPTTILNFPVDAHLKLKRLAKDRGCSMNALMNGGLKVFIERLTKKPLIHGESGGPEGGARSLRLRARKQDGKATQKKN
jgi:hypothetical protein